MRDLVQVEARLRDDHRIGVLINNAGTAPAGGFVDQNLDEVARIVNLRRETVTIPPLPDAAQWTDFEAARQVMSPNFIQVHAAARYRHLAA